MPGSPAPVALNELGFYVLAGAPKSPADLLPEMRGRGSSSRSSTPTARIRPARRFDDVPANPGAPG